MPPLFETPAQRLERERREWVEKQRREEQERRNATMRASAAAHRGQAQIGVDPSRRSWNPWEDRPQTAGVDGHEFVGLLKNALEEVAGIAKGVGPALYQTGKALASDFTDPEQWDPRNAGKSATYREVVKPQAEYYNERYVTPFREEGLGGFGRVAESLYNKPVSGILDFAGVAALGRGALSRGATLAKAEGGPLERLRATNALPEPRMLTGTVAGKPGPSVQTPTSPNALTRDIQGWYDRYSERNPEARMVGANVRVAKQKAKELRVEQDRVRARAHSDISAIRGPDTFHPLNERALRTSLFYEAQLPDVAHGGEGLQRLLNDLHSVREQMALTPSRDNPSAPRIVRQLNRKIRKLDGALEATRKPKYQAALEGARNLSQEAEGIFLEAGVLDPATAQLRRGLLSERAGYAIDEYGVPDTFVTHKSKPGRRSDERLGRTRVGLGKTQVPTNLTNKNELKLYEQGRLRDDPDVIVEHWSRAQTFDFHNKVKDFLAQFGEPIVERPNPGWYLVNRNGRATPDHWKDVIDGDEQVMFQSLRDYVRKYIAEGDSPEARDMLATHPEDVLQVDPKIVRQFFDRFVGPQGTASGAKAAIQTVDLYNGLVKTSLLYANPGYIVPNLAGNLVFAGLHQGVFLPTNLYRAGKALASDRELANLIRAEVGVGPTTSLASESTGPSRIVNAALRGEQNVAKTVGAIPDTWPRMAAWYFEARKAGFRTREKQMKLLTDPRLRPQLNDIRSRANEPMVNFDRLGPLERSVLKRIFFVWPWIRGAAAWPGRFAKDRPIRSSLLTDMAEREAQQTERELGPLPSWLEGAVNLGRQGPIANILPTRSINPLGVTSDLVNKATGKGTYDDVFSMVNPAIDLAINVAKRENEFGSKVGYKQALIEGAQALSPAYRLQDELRNPPRSDVYVDSDPWAIIQRRVIRVAPTRVKLAGVNAKARAEGDESAKTLEQEKSEELSRARRLLRQAGGTSLPPAIVAAYDARYAVMGAKEALKDDLDVRKLTETQNLAVLLNVLLELNPSMDEGAVREVFQQAKGDPSQVRELTSRIEDALGFNELREFSRKLNEFEFSRLEEKALAHG